ncbi:dnaJ homolog subfamily C member 2 [Lycorma delicatula]|uniref:dnaJ homolog subfamily C member 2 n=1 Tax=Lycorma delicatula TaxID=130591 RepID=UPI003F51152D
MGEGNVQDNKQLAVTLYKPWVLEYETPTTLRFVQIDYHTPQDSKGDRNQSDSTSDKSTSTKDGEEPLSKESSTTTIIEEDDVVFLRSLDPKEWKKQDHYKVLGLHHLRFKATEADIKKAYRRKVLKHHPDKRKAMGEEVRDDDDYFTCITKAWETLGDKTKRRSYDSVDPHFDDTIPSNNDYNKNNFYEVFNEAFDMNAQWSEKTPVPKLGGANATREEVDRFYTFWYNFESWREYSYLDEEEKEKGQDRDERKWIEKQNKAARAKLKKEEMVRIRNLIDLAYSIDPRINKFKLEDKEKKLAMKKAKQDAARQRQEEEERLVKEKEEKERAAKEMAEAEEKAKQQALKAEREAQKRVLKKERKNLRDLCKKNNYYSLNQEETVKNMTNLEKICEALDASQLANFSKELLSSGREAFLKAVEEMERRIQEERKSQMEMAGLKQSSSSSVSNTSSGSGSKKGSDYWPPDHVQMLIKAVNMFPAGTSQRWEVVANFLNQHCSNGTPNTKTIRTAKEVLAKAKELKDSDFSKSQLKEVANQKAYDNFEKDKKGAIGQIDATVSERFETVAEQQGLPKPWTAEEQQLLEQALKTYNSSTPERWDRIAECIPSRTKKECMKRYKELCEMVKAKKAAQAAATTNNKK